MRWCLTLLALALAAAGSAWWLSGGPRPGRALELPAPTPATAPAPVADLSSAEPASASNDAALRAAPPEPSRVPVPAQVIRGRLLAPRDMPLPPDAALFVVQDHADWRGFLHQRSEPRERVALAADGSFEFAWPVDQERVTLFADAPTLANAALAVVFRVGPEAFEFARVARKPGSWIQPSLLPGSRAPYAEGWFELRAHPALVLTGRLTDEPARIEVEPRFQRAHLCLHAWQGEAFEQSVELGPGEAFRIEHVPLDGPIHVRIDGPGHWLASTLVEDPRAGETRDLGLLGERRYQLRGRLLDEHGQRVSSGGVRALEIDADGNVSDLGWSETDAAGGFVLARVPLRPFHVQAGRRQPEYGVHGALTRYAVAPDPALFAAGLELVLPPVARIEGSVQRPDGTPAATARLRVTAAELVDALGRVHIPGTQPYAVDEYGRFVLDDLVASEHRLRLWEDRQLHNEPNLIAVVDVRAPALDLEIRLAPIAPLRGRVVQEDGTPWDGSWFLETTDDDVDWWGETYTVAEFEHARLWPGRWWIRARTDSGLQSRKLELEVPADLAHELVLVLQP